MCVCPRNLKIEIQPCLKFDAFFGLVCRLYFVWIINILTFQFFLYKSIVNLWFGNIMFVSFVFEKIRSTCINIIKALALYSKCKFNKYCLSQVYFLIHNICMFFLIRILYERLGGIGSVCLCFRFDLRLTVIKIKL